MAAPSQAARRSTGRTRAWRLQCLTEMRRDGVGRMRYGNTIERWNRTAAKVIMAAERGSAHAALVQARRTYSQGCGMDEWSDAAESLCVQCSLFARTDLFHDAKASLRRSRRTDLQGFVSKIVSRAANEAPNPTTNALPWRCEFATSSIRTAIRHSSTRRDVSSCNPHTNALGMRALTIENQACESKYPGSPHLSLPQ